MRECNRQQFSCGPDPGRVMVHACRDFGGIGVIVETAPHFQQLGDGDLVAVGYARDVLRHRIVEAELALLSQLQDHRGRHRLGIGGGPEIGVGAGRVFCAQ